MYITNAVWLVILFCNNQDVTFPKAAAIAAWTKTSKQIAEDCSFEVHKTETLDGIKNDKTISISGHSGRALYFMNSQGGESVYGSNNEYAFLVNKKNGDKKWVLADLEKPIKGRLSSTMRSFVGSNLLSPTSSLMDTPLQELFSNSDFVVSGCKLANNFYNIDFVFKHEFENNAVKRSLTSKGTIEIRDNSTYDLASATYTTLSEDKEHNEVNAVAVSQIDKNTVRYSRKCKFVINHTTHVRDQDARIVQIQKPSDFDKRVALPFYEIYLSSVSTDAASNVPWHVYFALAGIAFLAIGVTIICFRGRKGVRKQTS